MEAIAEDAVTATPTPKAKAIDEHRLQPMTVTVEEAGRALGIGRNAAYEAVKRGQIPSLKLGRRIVVPIAGLEQLVAGK